jgi:hypothetical protein
VEVYCASQRQWVASTVLDILPHRSVHIDCGTYEKIVPLSQCTSCTIRKKAPVGLNSLLQAKEEMPSFERNEAVEVYCASQRQWVASTVLDILPHRSVHIDCGTYEKIVPLSQCTSCTIRKTTPVERNGSVERQWVASAFAGDVHSYEEFLFLAGVNGAFDDQHA